MFNTQMSTITSPKNAPRWRKHSIRSNSRKCLSPSSQDFFASTLVFVYIVRTVLHSKLMADDGLSALMNMDLKLWSLTLWRRASFTLPITPNAPVTVMVRNYIHHSFRPFYLNGLAVDCYATLRRFPHCARSQIRRRQNVAELNCSALRLSWNCCVLIY